MEMLYNAINIIVSIIIIIIGIITIYAGTELYDRPIGVPVIIIAVLGVANRVSILATQI